jgi:hypothetical protein
MVNIVVIVVVVVTAAVAASSSSSTTRLDPLTQDLPMRPCWFGFFLPPPRPGSLPGPPLNCVILLLLVVIIITILALLVVTWVDIITTVGSLPMVPLRAAPMTIDSFLCVHRDHVFPNVVLLCLF